MRYVRAVLFVLILVSIAQAQQRWTKTYGGLDGDYGRFVQQTADSGYIVTGYTLSFGVGYNDFYLIKTNGSGDTLWTGTYGDTGYQGSWSVRQTADKGYVMTGTTMPPGGTSFDVQIVKTNASGGPVWTKKYGGTGSDEGHDVRQTADGGYIVAGSTTSFGAGTLDLLLIRTTGSGDSVWVKAIGGNGYETGYSILQTADGGYAIAGYTTGIGGFNEDVYLVRTSASGDTVWTRHYGGTEDEAGLCVDQTADGGYVIVGAHMSGSGDQNVYLLKTDASGETLWTRSYGGPHFDVGNSVRQTGDGGYIIAGTSYRSVGDADAYLIKTNALGDTLWTRVFGGTGVDGGNSVQQTLDGGYIIAGRTTSFGAGNDDVWLIKTDADGYAGVDEPGGDRQRAPARLSAVPNPFVFSARIPGHEAQRFELFDATGKTKGTYAGNRIGEGLAPAVYFVRPVDECGPCLRVVKVR